MAKLTQKQQRFADEYIISGNATQSYIDAGYSANKRTVAEANARRLLGNDSVRNYLDMRMKELQSESIADQEEVMQYLTRLMRGEEHETEMINVGNFEQELVEVPVKHNVRKQAAELIGKRYGLWKDRIEQTNRNIDIVVGEWEDDE